MLMKDCILSIETSSDICSVALHSEGVLVATSSCHIPQSHHRVVSRMIAHLVEVSSLSPASIQAVAVSYGPGSYTGLRIGISLAKGLAYGWGIPLVTVNTLEALAHIGRQAVVTRGYIGALMDARRARAYTLIMEAASGEIVIPAMVMDISQAHLPITPTPHAPLYLVGSGADQYATSLGMHPAIHIIQGVRPQAAVVGRIAYPKYLKRAWADLAYVEPLYLND